MMDNLTLAQQIVKRHIGTKPAEGHTVVVLEGDEFRFQIEPGQAPPRSWRGAFQSLFGRADDRYVAYAVDGDPQLRATFTTDVTMHTRIHIVAVRMTLAYRVSDPKKLVIHRNSDPLRKVRDEIADVLRLEFGQREWLDVLTDFQSAARQIVARSLGTIAEFAATYGLTIDTLTLDHTLPPNELKRQRDLEEARLRKGVEDARKAQETADAALEAKRKHEQLLLEQQLELEREKDRNLHVINNRGIAVTVGGYRRLDALADSVTHASQEAIGKSGMSVQDPKDLPGFARSMKVAMAEIVQGTVPGNAIMPDSQVLLEAGHNSGAAAVIVEMLGKTGQFGLERPERLNLQSAILHLIAELLRESNASAAIVEDYVQKVSSIRANMRELEQLDALQKFTNAPALALELR